MLAVSQRLQPPATPRFLVAQVGRFLDAGGWVTISCCSPTRRQHVCTTCVYNVCVYPPVCTSAIWIPGSCFTDDQGFSRGMKNHRRNERASLKTAGVCCLSIFTYSVISCRPCRTCHPIHGAEVAVWSASDGMTACCMWFISGCLSNLTTTHHCIPVAPWEASC